jgi:hypothetical protein
MPKGSKLSQDENFGSVFFIHSNSPFIHAVQFFGVCPISAHRIRAVLACLSATSEKTEPAHCGCFLYFLRLLGSSFSFSDCLYILLQLVEWLAYRKSTTQRQYIHKRQKHPYLQPGNQPTDFRLLQILPFLC